MSKVPPRAEQAKDVLHRLKAHGRELATVIIIGQFMLVIAEIAGGTARRLGWTAMFIHALLALLVGAWVHKAFCLAWLRTALDKPWSSASVWTKDRNVLRVLGAYLALASLLFLPLLPAALLQLLLRPGRRVWHPFFGFAGLHGAALVLGAFGLLMGALLVARMSAAPYLASAGVRNALSKAWQRSEGSSGAYFVAWVRAWSPLAAAWSLALFAALRFGSKDPEIKAMIAILAFLLTALTGSYGGVSQALWALAEHPKHLSAKPTRAKKRP